MDQLASGAGRCPACGGRLAPWRTVASSEPALAGLGFALERCDSCASAVTVGDAPPELHETGSNPHSGERWPPPRSASRSSA